MADPTSSHPIADKALARLKKLAEGNQVKPDELHLYFSEENTYTLRGTITLLPLFEVETVRFAGAPRGRNPKIMQSIAALRAELARLKDAFERRPDWITEAIAQLKEQPAGGWGLDDVKITLPNHNQILASSETCPSCHGNATLTCQQCHGQGYNTCPQCQGRRQEQCPVCLGTGDNPSAHGQRCINCNGLRYTSCRYCQGSGQLTCPTCHGKRGTTCSACQGAGQFTEQATIACGARTQFKLNADNVPSGLRRGLDRLGMSNLANGHADIEILPPAPPEKDEVDISRPAIQGASQPKAEPAPKPEVHYVAHVPYADMRMSFAKKKVIIGVFGKKNVILGVPTFLDHALEGMRETLSKAAQGGANLEPLLDIRLMRDALKLQLQGEGQINALRRIYPLGLSTQVAGEILANMRLALNQMTLRSRSLAAIACTVIGGGIFAGIYLTDIHNQITKDWSMMVELVFDLGVLCVVMMVCWVALSIVTRLVLQKRFPDFIIPITQKTGKTGYLMFAFLILAFAAMLYLAPAHSAWLQLLLPGLR